MHLNVWTLEPMLRLKTLASMVEACRDAKGGFLLSHIYLLSPPRKPLDLLHREKHPLYHLQTHVHHVTKVDRGRHSGRSFQRIFHRFRSQSPQRSIVAR